MNWLNCISCWGRYAWLETVWKSFVLGSTCRQSHDSTEADYCSFKDAYERKTSINTRHVHKLIHRHTQPHPGAVSASNFHWLSVQCCCSGRMMHGVLWRDIRLCTHTHNNGSAKPGHENSCSSFPRASTTKAWKSGIHLNHCISHLAHYPFVMAALCLYLHYMSLHLCGQFFVWPS